MGVDTRSWLRVGIIGEPRQYTLWNKREKNPQQRCNRTREFSTNNIISYTIYHHYQNIIQQDSLVCSSTSLKILLYD